MKQLPETVNHIAFDTNFLVYMIKQKVNAIEQIEKLLSGHNKYFIPDQVIAEIGRMDDGLKTKKLAVLIRSELNRHEVKKITILAGNADKALIELSKKGFFVCTNDKLLKKRINKSGGKIIQFRQKKLIDIY